MSLFCPNPLRLSIGKVKRSTIEGSIVGFWKYETSCCLEGMTANMVQVIRVSVGDAFGCRM